jgi:hypothetical protein
LRIDVAGISFEDQLGAVFRFLLMTAGKRNLPSSICASQLSGWSSTVR